MEPLLPHEEASIQQNYGLKVATAIPIGTGAMSSTMALHTDRGRLFQKRYKPASDLNLNPSTHRPRIAFTHAAQGYLWDRGFPIPRLLRNRDSDTLTNEGSEIYAISEFVDGYNYDVAKPNGALKSAGDILGRIHGELRGFRPSVDFKWVPMHDEVINLLRLRLERIRTAASQTAGYPVSESQIAEWKTEVQRLAAELPVPDEGDWIIHGDYRAQNLKFHAEGKVKAILDLDTARSANRTFDLAYALVFFPAVYQNTPLAPHQKSVFLDAYEAVCPLTTSERKSLPAHLKLAFLRGMTLWLHLHDLGGMPDRVRPWILGYLSKETTVTE